jgi:signal peptidase II
MGAVAMVLPWLLAAAVLVADLYSKSWVHSHLPLMNSADYSYPYGGIAVFKSFLGVEFSISHLANRGAAWGALEEYQHSLVLLRILLVVAMVIYLLTSCRSTLWRWALCLVAAGALGNIIDYFLYGHVVDMFHFVLWGYDFPVFNVADAAVTTGVTTLLLASTWQEWQQREAL